MHHNRTLLLLLLSAYLCVLCIIIISVDYIVHRSPPGREWDIVPGSSSPPPRQSPSLAWPGAFGSTPSGRYPSTSSAVFLEMQGAGGTRFPFGKVQQPPPLRPCVTPLSRAAGGRGRSWHCERTTGLAVAPSTRRPAQGARRLGPRAFGRGLVSELSG